MKSIIGWGLALWILVFAVIAFLVHDMEGTWFAAVTWTAWYMGGWTVALFIIVMFARGVVSYTERA